MENQPCKPPMIKPGERLVSVLCTMPGSIYHNLPGTDCYDKIRDARTFSGQTPVIAHPPCRLFSRMRGFANRYPGEMNLAALCLWNVRTCGGVLEHPAQSVLWDMCRMPKPGQGVDIYGGFSIQIDQNAYGHPARKRTWLYIAGHTPRSIPAPLLSPVLPSAVISGTGKRVFLPEVPKALRSHTPLAFAEFLLSIARSSQPLPVGEHPILHRLD